MCAPFIFIATNKLREGKLAAERDRAADLGSFIENTEPQLLAFNEYVNEDGTELGVVQSSSLGTRENESVSTPRWRPVLVFAKSRALVRPASLGNRRGRRHRAPLGPRCERLSAGRSRACCGREPSVTASTELRPSCDPNTPKRPEVTYTRATALGPESRS
jgi:hypothetical protein